MILKHFYLISGLGSSLLRLLLFADLLLGEAVQSRKSCELTRRHFVGGSSLMLQTGLHRVGNESVANERSSQ